MLKNVTGFFPPELCLDSSVANLISSLGYSWVVHDKSADLSRPVYSYGSTDLKILVRNKVLSDLFAFNRTADISVMLEHIRASDSADHLIILDGETFGFHNLEGIPLLENLVQAAKNNDIL